MENHRAEWLPVTTKGHEEGQGNWFFIYFPLILLVNALQVLQDVKHSA